jgi:TfoX/Sxy family transcriptional regulator of competence genes
MFGANTPKGWPVASDREFVEYVCGQIDLPHELTHKKMFGEYALYLNGQVVAFVCDNQLYVKPTSAGREVLGTVSEHSPFPIAKPHFRIDEELEDRELLQRLLRATAKALPVPKPKPKSAKRDSKERA